MAKVLEKLNDAYVEPEVAAKLEQRLLQKLNDGGYDDFDELNPFVRKLTEELRAISGDLHLGVWPIEYAILTEDVTPEERERMLAVERYDNFGLVSVGRLPGNIGYLELSYFADPDIAGSTAVAAMNFLANSDALIIDVRRNGGGEGDLVNLLLSYLFTEPVHTIDVFSRLDDSTHQIWTMPYVPGPQLTDIPVFVLQSWRSASAAEDFAYALKTTGRGTLVGETTKGAANPVEEFVFPELSICMAVSAFRVTSPITGTCWEGVGVEPDIQVDAERALYAAGEEAMKRLLGTDTGAEIQRGREWALELYQAKLNQVSLEVDVLEGSTGQFGDILVRRDRDTLVLERPRRMPVTLIPLGDDAFAFEEVEGKVMFERDGGGTIFQLVVLHRNGGRSTHRRSGH
jgi:hypothetical protein